MARCERFLVVHGAHGNEKRHWQEWLVEALRRDGRDVAYPRLPAPDSPRLAAWLVAIHDEIRSAPKDSKLTVVCHSLGAIAWMHYATAVCSRVADRVLLVAPPYVMRGVPPTDSPSGVEGFFPPPLSADAIAMAARETVIVASDNDDYATFEQARIYADRLSIPIHMLVGAGHISPYWGYGEWPWVLDWCVGRVGFPPEPRPT